MAAPNGHRYGWIRNAIPEPNEPGLHELVEDLRFMPGGETIHQYCTYAYDLCVVASQSLHAYSTLSNPLAICEVILAGLPMEEPWIVIKTLHNNLAVINDWGRLVPNESKYRNPANETYSMYPGLLRQRLWEIDQAQGDELDEVEPMMDAAEAEAGYEADDDDEVEPEDDPDEDPEEEEPIEEEPMDMEPEEPDEIHEVIDVEAAVDEIEIISTDDEEEYVPLTDDGEHDFIDVSSDEDY